MLIQVKCQWTHPNFHLSQISYFWKLSCDHTAIIIFQLLFQHLYQYPWPLIFKFIYEHIIHLHSVALNIIIANANFADFNLLLMYLYVYLRELMMQHCQTSSLDLMLTDFLIIFWMNSGDFLHFSLRLLNITHLNQMTLSIQNFSNF